MPLSHPGDPRFQAWVEHAPVAVFAVDAGGQYVDANPAAVAMLGYSLDELRERTIADICDPADLPTASKEFQGLVHGEALNSEFTLRRRDGTTLRASLRAVKIDEGIIVAFCSDITAQREAEARLRESQARLNDLVASMSDWAWEVDEQGRYTWASDAVVDLLGYTPAQLVGKSPFDFMPPAEAERVGKVFGEVVAARRPLVALPNVGLHRDGHLVHLETNGVPIFDAQGAFRGYRGADRDVTERVQHLAELTFAKEAAEAGTRAKSHFLATMSHELRTPLNGVQGMAQLLELTTLDDEQRDYLQTLRHSADDLLGLIDDVLEYTRLEAGTVPALTAPFSPRDLLDLVCSRLRPMVPADVQLGQVVDPSVPQLLVGDHTHLARVVEHLVGNALKFTHRGHVTVAARARERHGDTLLLEVTVRDTGVGIAPDTLKHLFDPLTAGDMSATRQFGGIGLGLSLCQRLAQLMDARLEASSTPGQGSIFRLLAPVGIGSTLVTPSPLPRLVSNHSLHVLLAEDNAINRRYAEALLRKLGHTVESVGDGFEALRAMERRSWDVVLMDLQMPRCSGLEAVQQLRAREANGQSHQVVLAVTAWARADERTDFLARGFDGLVPKPFDATSLMGELRRALDLAA